jgi:hypothetical protein
MKRAVIFDIDGTLADCTHRLHHINHDDYTASKDWPAFWAGIPHDKPIRPIIDMCNRFWLTSHWDQPVYEVLLCTGRSENNRGATEAWLKTHGVKYSTLIMRKEDCFRPDYVVKEEMLDALLLVGYQIDFVVDDRQQVVDMWRRRGIICLQCAPGNY